MKLEAHLIEIASSIREAIDFLVEQRMSDTIQRGARHSNSNYSREHSWSKLILLVMRFSNGSTNAKCISQVMPLWRIFEGNWW